MIVEESNNLILVSTEYGGHIGWYQGLNPKRWFVSKCIAFCEEAIRLEINKGVEEGKNVSNLKIDQD